ncbi:MAG: hypothetical protein RLZZ330_134 [Actinomycetota bacterium]|jgi:L-threonylcarbamoyladenylate synthase
MSQIKVLAADAVDAAVSTLNAGGLIGLPTETVYGLAAVAENENAVRRIYEVKGRPLDHPVIVHIGTFEEIDYWGKEISDETLLLAKTFWPGPLTLIVKRNKPAGDWLTGRQETVALRMPDHPVALAVLKKIGKGLAAPSANKFGSVSPTSALHVLQDLSNSLDATRDAVIDGGNCEVGVESTIVDCTAANPVALRPGAITQSQIDQVLNQKSEAKLENTIKAPGLLASHYAPKAKVLLANDFDEAQELANNVSGLFGFIATEKIPTLKGSLRLAMPKDNSDYAKELYDALRNGDEQGLQNIIAVLPEGDDIAIAIRDRLAKAAF